MTIRLMLAACVVRLIPASAGDWRVVDSRTGQPVAGAVFTPDTNGAARIGVRAHGYRAAWVPAGGNGKRTVELTAIRPKALYLSFWGIGTASLRDPALRLIAATELNALVIDVKGDRGMIAYPSSVALVAQAGARRFTTMPNPEALLGSLRQRGIYTIARIVVFKDDPLAAARPDLAVRTRQGGLYRDREHLAWSDPFREQVRAYNIDIAVEAARLGFDEIQFDYVRFPDANGLVFSQPDTETNRVAAISGFLAEAKRRLAPHNVFLAADVFGYILWNLNDTGIGQKLEELMAGVDYLSPMLYPSGFHRGIPGFPNPVASPYNIVHLSLERARARTHLPPVRFRPWLQAFRDYAFDHRPFTGIEIREQIRAAEDFGAGGWMLWNPRNDYGEEGLRK